MILCSKPSCPRPAAAALSYNYGARTAVLQDALHTESSPHLHRLCSTCADKLRPPLGWDLLDDRSPPTLWVARASTGPAEVADVGAAGDTGSPSGSP